jgi:hypothetical protein
MWFNFLCQGTRMMSRINWRPAAVYWICALILASASGCGNNQYKTAKVTGTVFCDGEPAEGGTIILRPIDAPEKTGRPKNMPGQEATGTVEADGTFSLTLAPVGDDTGRSGALIGPHEVIFGMPPTGARKIARRHEELSPEEAALKEDIDDEPVYEPLACGRAIWPDTVDVKPGKNVFDFVLLPKSFEPPPREKRRGHVIDQEYIKVDPSKLDPALRDAGKQ